MKNWSERLGDRRSHQRAKQAISAISIIGEQEYQGQTFDISQKGITLLTTPELPQVASFDLRCELPTGTSATFEVEVRDRRELTRGKRRFLRLGLSLLNDSLETVNFFKELAEHLLEQTNPDLARIGDLSIPTEPTDIEPGQPRQRPRLLFELPAVVHLGEIVYRLRTVDLGSWGMAVAAPAHFPQLEVFSLTFLDPDGPEITLLVREKYRTSLTGGGWRLGLQVIGGKDAFRGFVEKHAVWEDPES